jgi:long-subunit fatty acid transport protein
MNFKTQITNKILLLMVLFCFFTIASISQNLNKEKKHNFWDHVRFGGAVGLSFGDGFFSGTLAPSAIYDINDQFAVGLGLNGTINSRKNTYKSTILGGSIISLFNPIAEIQLSAEFEELNVSRTWDHSLGLDDQNYWYPALFVGAGYRTQNITLGIRYDVLYDKEKSVYAEPWAPFLRVYF